LHFKPEEAGDEVKKIRTNRLAAKVG